MKEKWKLGISPDSRIYRYQHTSKLEALLFSILRTGYLEMQSGYRVEREGYGTWALSVTVKGEGEFIQDGKRYPVQKGDILFFNQMDAHALHNPHAEQWCHYYIYFFGPQVSDFCAMFQSHFGPVAKSLPTEDIIARIQQIHTLVTAPLVDEAEISTLVYSIMIDLYRACGVDRNQKQIQPALIADSFLHEKYKSDLTLDDVAAFASVSKFYLAHLYKSTYGCSPMQRLLRIRFDKCMDAIESTDRTVSEILSDNNFVNYHLFIKLCRARTGMTPSAWRKHVRGRAPID